MKFELVGKPIPLARGRSSPRGFYDSQLIVKKNIASMIASLLPPDFKPFTGPITLEIQFFMPIPKSLSNKKKAALKGQPHTVRPDTTNLVKMIEDSLNETLWLDDCQIHVVHARKVWEDEGKTVFEIKE